MFQNGTGVRRSGCSSDSFWCASTISRIQLFLDYRKPFGPQKSDNGFSRPRRFAGAIVFLLARNSQHGNASVRQLKLNRRSVLNTSTDLTVQTCTLAWQNGEF
jgi:hypothetical protein